MTSDSASAVSSRSTRPGRGERDDRALVGVAVGPPPGGERRRPEHAQPQAGEASDWPALAPRRRVPAALSPRGPRPRWTGVGQPAPPSSTSRGGNAPHHGERRALVVGLRVGEDQHVEAADAGAAQPREDRAVGRPGVDEDRGAAVLHQRRVALADVEERDHELARGRRRRTAARVGDADADPGERQREHGDDPPAAARGRAARRRRPGAAERTQDRRSARRRAPRTRRRAPPARRGGRRRAASGARAAACATAPTKASSGAARRVEAAPRARATTCAAAAASIPSHMIGATAGAATRLAGSDASETCSKCSAISGAVPSVAATVIAAASATGAGQPAAERRAQRRAPSASSASDGGERQLPARLARGPRVERERDGRGEAERVPARSRRGPRAPPPARRRPSRRRAGSTGPPPASGT